MNSVVIWLFVRHEKVKAKSNILKVWFLKFRIQLQTEFNQLLISLNVCELLISGFGIPVDFVAAFQQGWKMGESFCIVTGFVLTFLGNNGVL